MVRESLESLRQLDLLHLPSKERPFPFPYTGQKLLQFLLSPHVLILFSEMKGKVQEWLDTSEPSKHGKKSVWEDARLTGIHKRLWILIPLSIPVTVIQWHSFVHSSRFTSPFLCQILTSSRGSLSCKTSVEQRLLLILLNRVSLFFVYFMSSTHLSRKR